MRDLLQHKPTRNIDRPNNQARFVAKVQTTEHFPANNILLFTHAAAQFFPPFLDAHVP